MSKYDRINSSFFKENRKRLCERLEPNSLAILFANEFCVKNADGVFPFQQNANLFYLTGIDQENVILILYPDAKCEEEREQLFIIETTEQIAIWDGEKLKKEEVTEISGIEQVNWFRRFDSIWKRQILKADLVYLSLNESFRSINEEGQNPNSRFVNRCQAEFPLHRYRRLDPILASLRSKKSSVEREQIGKALEITKSGYERVAKMIAPGVGEWEIEAEYAHEFLRLKSRGFAYPPIVASGKNTCVLHYSENDRVCQDGELLLLDIGAEWGNWNADVTRVFPINGKFSKRQRQVYDAVLRISRFATDLLEPGLSPNEHQEKVFEKTGEELIRLNLIDSNLKGSTLSSAINKYFMHTVSHHLGLDVHDVAPITEFEEGMLITVEPGIYIKEEKIGIRLEDDFLIQKGKNLNLSASIPIEADDIEAMMA